MGRTDLRLNLQWIFFLSVCHKMETSRIIFSIYEEEKRFWAKEMVIVMDFGGQYNQLIARRVKMQCIL